MVPKLGSFMGCATETFHDTATGGAKEFTAPKRKIKRHMMSAHLYAHTSVRVHINRSHVYVHIYIHA